MFLSFKQHVNSLPSVEQWAERNQHKATPDGIISAAVVQSFASLFEDWMGKGTYGHTALPDLPERKQIYSDGDIHAVTIQNVKTGTVVVFHYKKGKRVGEYSSTYHYRIMNRVTVNGLQLDAPSSKLIVDMFMKVMSKVKAVEATAARVKADMERNEQAWNLAEKLLGMKRNEYGALVPVKTAEGNDENGGQTEQAPPRVRRKADDASRTPKRNARRASGSPNP